ncbi:MAG: protein kinase domain-containing protein [Spirochaetia bacterium]
MAKIPEKIGKYTIYSQIAKGGMGAVYKGKHPTLDRPIILKKLTLRGSTDFRERFRREARIMMDFKNDFIVDVYDHFKEGASYYIVLEYVEGTSLEDLLKKERYLPDDVALLILRDTCKALLYAHSKGVIHRDIKPGNILLSKKGEVKLADFGIAISKEDQAKNLTREGMTLGTPSYMAPEQFRNSKNVDHRADIYSLGVMLYEMVTGKKPFPSKISPDALALIQKGKYRDPRKINPRIKGQTASIIKRCMRVKPGKRYQTLSRLISFLNRKLKTESQEAVRKRIREYIAGRTLPEKKKKSARAKGAAAAVIVFFFLGFVLAAYYFYSKNFFHAVVYPEKYGALRVAVRSTPGNPVRGRVEKMDEGSEPVPLGFKERETESGRIKEYTTGIKYLPAGLYSLTIESDFGIYRRSFYLEPRTLQKTDPVSRQYEPVEINIGSIPAVPLETNFRVIDRASGNDITVDSTLYYEDAGAWRVFGAYNLPEIISGRTYRFRITAPHFYPETVELKTDSTHHTADMTVALNPHPGTIRIIKNYAGIRLLIDGSRHYVQGGRNTVIKEITGAADGEAADYILNPGPVRITAVYRGERTEKLIHLETSELIQLSIQYSEEGDELTIITLPQL